MSTNSISNPEQYPNIKSPSSFVNAVEADEQKLQTYLQGDLPIMFDWKNRWLKGEEYAHIITRMEAYCQAFQLEKFSQKTHPSSIYEQPINGMIYFVKGNSIGSDFGFPRLAFKKHFKWKKMNFTTDLPKKLPIVSYIVASAVKCEKFYPGSAKEGPAFRMHAVILSKQNPRVNQLSQGLEDPKSNPSHQNKSLARQSQKNNGASKWVPAQNASNYILCHVRQVTNKGHDSDDEIMSQLAKISPKVDFLTTLEESFKTCEKEKSENKKGVSLVNLGETINKDKFENLSLIPARRRAFTDCFDLQKCEEKEEIKSQKESNSSTQSFQEDSEYNGGSANASRKKRVAKFERKLNSKNNFKLQTPQLLINTPPFGNLNLYNFQDKIQVEQDAKLFATCLSLQKRQKRAESMDFSQFQQKKLFEEVVNPFDFTSSFKPTQPCPSPQVKAINVYQPLQFNTNLPRKLSELNSGDIEQKSAFKKLHLLSPKPQTDQQVINLQSPSFSLLPPQLSLQAILSAQIGHLQQQSRRLSYNSQGLNYYQDHSL